MSTPRRPIGALIVVLLADISGVSTIAVATATARTDAALLLCCFIVGLAAWVLAVIAVTYYRKGGGVRQCRRLIWIGLLVNTVGSVALAITAALFDAPTGLLTAGILAVVGAALSFAYLGLLRRRDPLRRAGTL